MTVADLLAEAAEAPMGGSDFSWLGPRMRRERPPWDYDALVCAPASAAFSSRRASAAR